MPKVSIARIRLYLKTGKVLSDGTSPIMLRCSFNGSREISTGYGCQKKYWDSASESVKKGFPNFVMINYEINKLKNMAIERRNEYERLGQSYTPDMVLSPRKVLSAVGNDLKGLIECYIEEKGLENRTVEKWWIVYRSLVKYSGREISINEINEGYCRGYGRWLEVNGLSNGSIRSYLGKVGAICHYAISKGLINEYPFSNWKYHKDYRESKSELYIHHRSMDIMIEMFINECLEIKDNGLFRYKEGVLDRLMDIHSELYSHYLYIATYHLSGLGPVDISMLRKVDIKMVDIKGISCYAIDGYRSKTGMSYKIRLRRDDILSRLIIETMLMFHQGEYLLPTLEGYIGKDIKKRVNNLYTYHGENLVNWFRCINEEIVRRNIEGGDSIPLIDLDCRYYSARHSFIMKEIQKPNVNLIRLATVTGKSVQTLHQYISLLGDLDLVE